MLRGGKYFPWPIILKNILIKGRTDLWGGKGYKYPHDFGGYVEQDYVPGRVSYYKPTVNGFEGEIRKRLEGLKKAEPRKG